MWSDGSFYAWIHYILTAKGICGNHSQIQVAGQCLRQTRQSVTPWINDLLREEYNMMLFSEMHSLFLLSFHGSLKLCTLTAHLWRFANTAEAFSAPGSSFIIQNHSNTNDFFQKRQEASLKSIMPGSCHWREGKTEALRAKGWEIKVGRGEGFLFLKDTVTQCSQISPALALPLAASSCIHTAGCSKLLQSVTLEKYLQRIRVFYTIPDVFFSSPCWT